jgi:hypothetical protein
LNNNNIIKTFVLIISFLLPQFDCFSGAAADDDDDDDDDDGREDEEKVYIFFINWSN